ncbi:MAG: diguanylate cyclase [Armatimonadota bacterium]
MRVVGDLRAFLREHAESIVDSWGARLAEIGGPLAELADREAGAWLAALQAIADEPAAAADAHKALSKGAMQAGLTGAETGQAYSALREAVLTTIVREAAEDAEALSALVAAASRQMDEGVRWLYEESQTAADGLSVLRAPYRRLIENASDVIISLDAEGCIAYVNPKLIAVTGFSMDELIGQHFSFLLTPESAARADADFERARSGDRGTEAYEVDIVVKGSEACVPVELAGIALHEYGEFAGRLLIGRDITKRRQAADQLQRQNRQLMALNAVSEAIAGSLELHESLGAAVDQVARLLETDYAGVFLLGGEAHALNLTFQRGASTPGGAVEAHSPSRDLTGAAIASGEPLFVDDISADPALAPPAARNEGLRATGVVPLKARERPLGVLILGYRGERRFADGDKQLLGLVGRQIGVAVENAMLFDQARRAAVTDSLTGLYDHGEVWRRLEAEAERSRRYRRALAFMLADLDDLKHINDSFGHIVGDAVLKRVSQVLTDSIRAADTAARYGGDEFAVILPETNVQRAQTVAERILSAVGSDLFTLEGGAKGPRVTMSVGVAASNGNMGAAELVHAADKAVYRAKARGGNVVVAYEA